ncbi:Succinylglutamate desuccinylase / Aspartoacylase family protein [Planctomycetes bacterium K23_9]|uniref:Succinylglutamate desuccinylase / Aspartoacylase family protein n=2 Tax=Stieleria marina TaxID=1930275 RepID=A0A517P038_9BACT|nr:Succinylglutamate desuccinylase / Aspartoacylase family protein [Planctomycetes bacterium K23_9]
MKPADLLNCFSPDYFVAKDRFIQAAQNCDAILQSFPIGDDSDLSIDVATINGGSRGHTTVISSGLHGVEGFFGSAVQLAFLSQIAEQNAAASPIVLIHAINPFGFANLRRWNENNVDLNRNFCQSNDDFRGSPPAYADLNSLLNPQTPPSPFEPFLAKAALQILHRGMPAIKQAVAGGQYDFPAGMFFGGSERSASTKIIQQNYGNWIGESQNVIHMDLHTGLGKRAACKLLLEETRDAESYPWYAKTFGEQYVEASRLHPNDAADRTAYQASGSLGSWLHKANPNRNFRFALAEFGTYGLVKVLAALRAENRAHFHANASDSRYQRAKSNLVEHFCPAGPAWRSEVIEKATQIIHQATDADWSDL